MPGVYRIFTAADIPGKNSFYPNGAPEPVLLPIDKPIPFYGQPIALLVADTFDRANAAAQKVRIIYSEPDAESVIIPTLHDVHRLKATDRYADIPMKLTATKYGEAVATDTIALSGEFYIGSQYHYTMETQTAVCRPAEDGGLDVFSSTQWVDFTQEAIADMLAIPNNTINMQMRRVGGGYGAKLTRCAQMACAAALACRLTGRPVRFVMTLESNMAVVGRRLDLLDEYEAQVDKHSGRIQRLTHNFAQDYGSSLNDPVAFNTISFLANCYAKDAWDVNARTASTNAPGHTWCRAPGSVEGIGMTENLMEHIAVATGLDPIAVRLANMPEGHRIRELLPEFLVDCGEF